MECSETRTEERETRVVALPEAIQFAGAEQRDLEAYMC
jgi:hypothetical protein